MYLGQMVEEASVTDIFEHPLHPYTVGLIQSIPQMTTDSEQELFMIKGSLPLLTQIKKAAVLRQDVRMRQTNAGKKNRNCRKQVKITV